jgi:hypothetical protein
MSDRRVELVDLDTVTAYVSEMQEILNESSLTERRAFVRSFINKIQVKGNEALMTYSLPIPPDNVTLNTEPVPRIIHHGGPWGTVPELLFEKKGLIPAVQQLLVSHPLLT